MDIYLITQSVATGCDTYDSAVVAAESEEAARNTHPRLFPDWDRREDSWASSPDQVSAVLIGTAVPGTSAGVICASFNAS